MHSTLRLGGFAEAACYAAQLPHHKIVYVDDPYLYTALLDVIGSDRVKLILKLSDQKQLYSKRCFYLMRDDSKVRWVRKDAVWGCDDAKKIRSKLFVNESQLKDYVIFHTNPGVTFCTEDRDLLERIGSWRHDIWVTANILNLLAIKIVVGTPKCDTVDLIDRYTLYLWEGCRKGA